VHSDSRLSLAGFSLRRATAMDRNNVSHTAHLDMVTEYR
jgi:hypothetical protein